MAQLRPRLLHYVPFPTPSELRRGFCKFQVSFRTLASRTFWFSLLNARCVTALCLRHFRKVPTNHLDWRVTDCDGSRKVVLVNSKVTVLEMASAIHTELWYSISPEGTTPRRFIRYAVQCESLLGSRNNEYGFTEICCTTVSGTIYPVSISPCDNISRCITSLVIYMLITEVANDRGGALPVCHPWLLGQSGRDFVLVIGVKAVPSPRRRHRCVVCPVVRVFVLSARKLHRSKAGALLTRHVAPQPHTRSQVGRRRTPNRQLRWY